MDKGANLGVSASKVARKVDWDDAASVNNEGNRLACLAEETGGPEAIGIYKEAERLFRRAAELAPDEPDVLDNLGQSLYYRGMLTEGAEGDALLTEALQQFRGNLRLQPDYCWSRLYAGLTLAEMARRAHRSPSEERQSAAAQLFREADEELERAADAWPDDNSALSHWARVLVDWADCSPETEAAELLRRAAEVFGRAVALEPDDWGALCNWGGALTSCATIAEGSEAERLFDEAEDKYRRALAIEPDDAKTWFNWGGALVRRSRLPGRGESLELILAAEDKFKRAVEITPNYPRAYCEWAEALLVRADRSPIDLVLALHLQAEAMCRRAAELRPDWYLPHYTWGASSVERGVYGPPTDRPAALELAQQRFTTSERLYPGSSGYYLACVAAQTGRQEDCRRWLESALEHGRLPELAFMENEHFLDPVKREPWFQELMSSAFPD